MSERKPPKDEEKEDIPEPQEDPGTTLESAAEKVAEAEAISDTEALTESFHQTESASMNFRKNMRSESSEFFRGAIYQGDLEHSRNSSSAFLSTGGRHKLNNSVRAKYDDKLRNKLKEHVLSHREQFQNETIEEQEVRIRQESASTPMDFVTSIRASLMVLFVFLFTKETYLTLFLSVGSTCYFYFQNNDNLDFDGGGVPFSLLAIAVVIPTVQLLSMLFKRREMALMRMGEMRGFLLQLYQLHSILDWKAGSGRKIQSSDDPNYLGIEHSDQVADNIIGLFDELMRYLTLPSSTETRHLLTKRGHLQAGYIRSVEEPIFLSCTTRRMVRFAALTERLKAAGLKENECIRMQSYHMKIQTQMEHLRNLKSYRTPQVFRSLSRMTPIIMLPLFGPSFAQLAMDVDSLVLGLFLASASALILAGLYEATRVAEDPFTAFVVVDGVNFAEEMELLHKQIITLRDELWGEEAHDNPYLVPPACCLTGEYTWRDRQNGIHGTTQSDLRTSRRDSRGRSSLYGNKIKSGIQIIHTVPNRRQSLVNMNRFRQSVIVGNNEHH